MEDCLSPEALRRVLLMHFFTRDVPGVFVRAARWPFRQRRRTARRKGT
jgi:hypothetical protein